MLWMFLWAVENAAPVQAEAPSHMLLMVPPEGEQEEERESLTDPGGSAGDSTALEAAAEPVPAKEDAASRGAPSLYALSAVLMDGDTGRVLYSRDGDTPLPMASTTKVMTCILALENASGDEIVRVSANAAAQPDVQLNIREGEQYRLEDLLYSLMLKSHNDVAVAVAEHVGGSVESFAQLMNQKARELGCRDTHFVTPNGLDARDSGGEHHTTARDLALIMRYAVKNSRFLKITRTRDYSFSDVSGGRQFSIHNANALLDMTEDVISGKTGYTAKAGYCYVCACGKEGKTFIISLLGCGWPSHKTYKWKDTLALLNYGNDHFHFADVWKEPVLKEVPVDNGVTADSGLQEAVRLQGVYTLPEGLRERRILLGEGEEIELRTELPDSLTAPVAKGERIGSLSCALDGELLWSVPILAEKTVQKRTYLWCADRVFHSFFH